MDQRTMRLVGLLIVLAFGMAGCLGHVVPKPVPVPNTPGPGDGNGPAPNPDPPGPAEPEQPVEPDQPGPVRQLSGQVVFANTNLPLWAIIDIGSESITTETGDFTVSVATGQVAYTLHTLLGTSNDTVAHDGQGTKVLIYPAFPGWSEVYFNTLLATFSSQGDQSTVRWPRHKIIPVWIEGPTDNPQVSDEAVNVAWDVFVEWQRILQNAITFNRVATAGQAEGGITVRYDTPKNLNPTGGNTIGYCRLSYSSLNSQLVAGQIVLDYGYQTSRALVRHELGHCIGLGHSSDRNDAMYPTLTHDKDQLTDKEKQMARLLYSIPSGTGPLGHFPASMPSGSHTDADGDIVTVIIPTYATINP